MAGGMVEVAKATVTLVPNMAGAQGEITQQLTGITKDASEKAGDEGGSAFGSKFAGAVKGSAAVIGAAIAGATAAAVGTGKAFVDAAKDVAAYGDTVDKQSQRLGLSAKSYQELDYVMNLAGTSMDSMSMGVKTLTNQLDAAKNGSEAAQGMFAALGLSMDDLANMSREDVFKSVIMSFSGMEDSAERAALANDLLGRSGQQLAPLFNMTAEEIAGAIEQANEYGMVMDDSAVKASANFTDSMTTLKMTMTGVKNSLMSEFLPGLTQVTSGLAAVFAGDESGIGQIESGLSQVITNITAMAPQFFQLASTIVSGILAGFAPMLPGLVSELFSFLTNAIITITGLIPQLTPVITSGLQQVGQALFTALPVLLSSLIQMAQDIVLWLASGDNVKTFIDGILQLVSILATGLADSLPILLPAIINIIGQIADSLTDPDNVNMILTSIAYILGAIFVALVNAVPELLNFIIKVGANILGLLADWGGKLFGWLGSLITGAFSKVKDFLTNIKTTLTNAGNNIKNGVSNFFNNIKNAFTNAGNNIRNGATNIKNKVVELVTGIFSKISELPGKVVSIGKDLVEGLWNGINDKIAWVKNKIASMGQAITNAIKGVFGIASPSKVWAKEIGAMLPPGLYNGFEKSMDNVKSEIAEDMSGLTASVSADVSAYGTAGAAMYDSMGETINSGGNVINVYASEGQDVRALADEIAVRLEDMTRRKGAVYA